MRRTRLVSEVDLDGVGAQRGFIRLFHSVHSSAYGFIPIPVVVLRNGEVVAEFDPEEADTDDLIRTALSNTD